MLASKRKVAVLRLSGVIADSTVRRSGISHAKLARQIEKAFRLPGLEAAALQINSPGGSPAQSALIAGHIVRLAREKEKPVFAFVEDVAASGGYWLACAADEIYVQDSSIVGSIGVISAGFGLEDFIAKHGIHRRLHTSGKDKSFLDPFAPEKEKDVSRLKELQKDIHERFKDWVRERRGKILNGKESELFEGAFWTGRKAIELGIADDVGEMRAVLREKFGEDIKFVDLQPQKKLLPSFLRSEGALQADWARDLLEIAEDRASWQRFGL
ncbi:MAG: S49 family peptidase [Alphaproteobacteria bacterium]|nr:S49 family peptidase [Alphaproteobacteria bacterium]